MDDKVERPRKVKHIGEISATFSSAVNSKRFPQDTTSDKPWDYFLKVLLRAIHVEWSHNDRRKLIGRNIGVHEAVCARLCRRIGALWVQGVHLAHPFGNSCSVYFTR